MVLLRLAPRARKTLRHMARTGRRGREVRRAQLLLWLDRRETVRQVAARVHLSRQAIYAIVRRYLSRRALPVRQRIADAPHRGRPATKRLRVRRVLQELLAVSPSHLSLSFTHLDGAHASLPSRKAPEMSDQRAHGAARAARVRQQLQAPALCLCPPSGLLATGKRGLKTGLKRRKRTVILFFDSTIFTETPPWRAMWAPRGAQVQMPITGSHDRRILSGVLNIKSGDYLDYISKQFTHVEFESVLRQVRRHWRGWRIVLFLDRNKPHKAVSSRQLARKLKIQLRWLPKACSELNALDQLWRRVKDEAAANEGMPNVDATVRRASRHIHALSPRERLRKAGVLSEDFWLADVVR